MKDAEVKVNGLTFKGWYLAAALPILSGLSGAIYFSYDTVQRFYSVESGIGQLSEVIVVTELNDVEVFSRLQALEQAISDNDVRGLNTKLSQLTTQMNTILEQQRELLSLRSAVERSQIITDGVDERLDSLQRDIDSTWLAIDELEKPL